MSQLRIPRQDRREICDFESRILLDPIMQRDMRFSRQTVARAHAEGENLIVLVKDQWRVGRYALKYFLGSASDLYIIPHEGQASVVRYTTEWDDPAVLGSFDVPEEVNYNSLTSLKFVPGIYHQMAGIIGKGQKGYYYKYADPINHIKQTLQQFVSINKGDVQ